MERKEVKKIGTLVDEFVKTHRLEEGLAEYRLKKSWKKLLGTGISRKTKSLVIKNRRLIVTIQSSVIRNELMMMKDTLIPRLNAEAGHDVIDDIVFK